ncbi:M48 family metallopeptidase [Wenyingzhuangia sp. IMCC45574]
MRKVIAYISIVAFVVACSTVPITGRKRLNFVSDSQILPTSFAQYDAFLKENKISKNGAKTAQIKRVGGRISKAVEKFMRANGMSAEADAYRWEFNLVEDKQLNAWCMPGGKVVFYTGILPVAKNENGIAAIMGHEIAHAFAKHGQERMSSAQIQQYGSAAIAIGTAGKDEKSKQLWNMAYGIGSQLGMLKYSRTHETEADKLGMVFMIMAGYDGSEAIRVWERMKALGGAKQPEFLSTHPSNDTRIRDLKAYLPQAKREALKYK